MRKVLTLLLFFLVSLISHAGDMDVKVYKGTSEYRSDIRFSFDGFLTIEEFVAVWHTALYVY